MEPNIEKIDSSSRRIKFQLPASELDQEIERRTRERSKKMSIPGFRKGKIPPKIVDKHHGKEIRAESISELLKDTLQSTLTNHGVQLVDPPYIEGYEINEERTNYEVLVRFNTIPEVSVTDISGCKTVQPVVTISEQELDNEIEILKRQHQVWKSVDRKAESNDRIRVISEVFDHELNKKHPKSEKFIELADENTFEQIRSGCIGASKGERVTAVVSIENKDGTTKQLSYFIDVQDVQEIAPGEYESKLYDRIGVKSLEDEDFREKTRIELEKATEINVRESMTQQVMTLLIDRNELVIPYSLVQRHIVDNVQRQAGVSEEQATQWVQNEENAYSVYLQAEQMRAGISSELILNKIMQERNLQIDEAAIREEVRQLKETASIGLENEQISAALMQAKRKEKEQEMVNTITEELVSQSKSESAQMSLDEYKKWVSEFNVIYYQDDSDHLKSDEDPQTQSAIVDEFGNPIEKSQ